MRINSYAEKESKTLFIILAFDVFLLFAYSLIPTPFSSEDETPTVFMDPSFMRLNPIASEIFLEIKVENVTDLYSWQVNVTFNNSTVKPTEIFEGSFIKENTQSPHGTFFISSIEDQYVLIACITMGAYPGVNGSGTLCSIVFEPFYGISDLTFENGTCLIDSSQDAIPYDSVNGVVVIAISGDVNADEIVDVWDITIVAMSYGYFQGEPNYNLLADINEDGIVDMFDLSLVAIHLGERYAQTLQKTSENQKCLNLALLVKT